MKNPPRGGFFVEECCDTISAVFTFAQPVDIPFKNLQSDFSNRAGSALAHYLCSEVCSISGKILFIIEFDTTVFTDKLRKNPLFGFFVNQNALTILFKRKNACAV
ncbi:hypothetical protein C2E19_27590 [Pseudomonas sp. DTU12.3]|nr:hypothetical protein C2E19_27590 [Pseudomonas sp. DTU12.3]